VELLLITESILFSYRAANKPFYILNLKYIYHQ